MEHFSSISYPSEPPSRQESEFFRVTGSGVAAHHWWPSLESLALLADEVRNPLQVALGYLDIIRDDWCHQFPAEPRHAIERIWIKILELNRTLDNLFDLALFEIDDEPLLVEDVRVRDLVEELLPELEAACRRLAKLDLRFELEEAPLVIRSDRRLMRSILANLVSNATRVCASGTVTVAIRRGTSPSGSDFFAPRLPSIELEVANRAAVSYVLDDCSLLEAKEDREHRHERCRGSVLGLSLVKLWAARLGGRFSLDSTSPGGTRLLVSFPMDGAGLTAG